MTTPVSVDPYKRAMAEHNDLWERMRLLLCDFFLEAAGPGPHHGRPRVALRLPTTGVAGVATLRPARMASRASAR